MIKSLDLTNFTCFTENTFDFVPGINVFIGKNGTGKTHIMKCLAATIKSNKEFKTALSQTQSKYGELLTHNLMAYFRPDELGHLVKKGEYACSIRLKNTAEESILYSFSSKMQLVKTERNKSITLPDALYIPPREVFSLFEGFISLAEKREISFDETYLQLAKSLDNNPLKGESYEEAMKLVKPLLSNWKVKVIKKNSRFYVIDHQKEYEAHLVAEGLRKIATLLYLVGNGELKKNSILFWDEPEANLNPSLIAVVVELLFTLAKQGVQIFLATHDYLLSHRLSLFAEYPTEESKSSFAFFNLQHVAETIVTETGSSLVDIQNNTILNEYAAFYDLETQLTNKY